MESFKKRLGGVLPTVPPPTTDKVATDDPVSLGLYSDFFVQTPQQLSLHEMDRIVKFFDQRTLTREVTVEGLYPEEMVLRVRAFGIT